LQTRLAALQRWAQTTRLRSATLGSMLSRLRQYCMALAFVASACATTGSQAVNVAHVRRDIGAVMSTHSEHRTITAMGHATVDTAVVFTTADDGSRRQEQWRRVSGNWVRVDAEPLARH